MPPADHASGYYDVEQITATNTYEIAVAHNPAYGSGGSARQPEAYGGLALDRLTYAGAQPQARSELASSETEYEPYPDNREVDDIDI